MEKLLLPELLLCVLLILLGGCNSGGSDSSIDTEQTADKGSDCQWNQHNWNGCNWK